MLILAGSISNKIVLKSYIIVISTLMFLFPSLLTAQEIESLKQDSNRILLSNVPDSIDTDPIRMNYVFKPNPTKAMIYSAVCPGLGQIYNRKYWKLPIVYGAYLGCAYAVSWNSNQYNGYKQAYKDWSDDDPNTNSWINYGNPGQDKNWFGNQLKQKRDYYRRYRDLSYIITVGVYALTIIDAYVDAQLFDFDISPDLTMRVEPVIFDKSSANSRSIGLQCGFRF